MTPLHSILSAIHTELSVPPTHSCFCTRQRTSSGRCHVCRVEELSDRVGSAKAARFYTALKELGRAAASILEESDGQDGP